MRSSTFGTSSAGSVPGTMASRRASKRSRTEDRAGIATRHLDAALGDRGVDLVVVAQQLQEAGTAEVDPHAAPGQVDLERLPLHGDGGRLAPEEQEEAARQDVRHPDRILPLPGGAARPRRPPS